MSRPAGTAAATDAKLMAGSRPVTMRRVILCVFLAIQLGACGGWLGSVPEALLETTFGKYLARAEAGDAESQNFVGYMLFHGEGVQADRRAAEVWFRRAAEQGSAKAQRNLAAMLSTSSVSLQIESARDAPAIPAPGRLTGEDLYARFCAGCHGFNGISAYVYSPSFALGQTLEKGDATLMRSLLNGKGEMPNWDDKLSRAELQDILRFVRTLPSRYELGIGQPLRGAPPVYFLFGPMKPGERAYRLPEW